MIIIGERINSSRTKIYRAIKEKSIAVMQKEAAMQVEAGNDYIDIDTDGLVEKEDEYLV